MIYQFGMEVMYNLLMMEVKVGNDYFRIFGVWLIVGWMFDVVYLGDDWLLWMKDSKVFFSVVINCIVLELFGFVSFQVSIGKLLEGNGVMMIIGVVDDLCFCGFWEMIGGVVYCYVGKLFGNVFVMLCYLGDLVVICDVVEVMWKWIVLMVLFNGCMIEVNFYEEYYKVDVQCV